MERLLLNTIARRFERNLKALKLFEFNILPYYIHLLDKVSGAERFLVTDKRAKEIYKTLQTLLPGYLVPRMVRDEGGDSKRLVL